MQLSALRCKCHSLALGLLSDRNWTKERQQPLRTFSYDQPIAYPGVTVAFSLYLWRLPYCHTLPLSKTNHRNGCWEADSLSPSVTTAHREVYSKQLPLSLIPFTWLFIEHEIQTYYSRSPLHDGNPFQSQLLLWNIVTVMVIHSKLMKILPPNQVISLF